MLNLYQDEITKNKCALSNKYFFSDNKIITLIKIHTHFVCMKLRLIWWVNFTFKFGNNLFSNLKFSSTICQSEV